MNFIPEWAPNVHPLVVHFPIAFLFAAAVVDAAALVLRRRYAGLSIAAVGLYVAGALTLIGTYFTGRAAADSVDLPTAAIAPVGAHADWATWTVWAFGFYGLLRLGAAFWKWEQRRTVHGALFLLGVAGLFLLQQTAERGARLVYDLGVGVRAVAQPTGDHASMTPGEPGATDAAALQTTDEGGWRWEATASSLPPDFYFLEGGREALTVEAAGDATVLRPRSAVFFTAGAPLEGVEVRAVVDLSGFTGRVTLVHHVQDARNYDFLAVEKRDSGGTMRQGRVRNGTTEIFDEAALEDAILTTAPMTLRAVAYGTHFRGYTNGTLATHGHGSAAPAGRVGLALDGTGALRLTRLEAVPVTE